MGDVLSLVRIFDNNLLLYDIFGFGTRFFAFMTWKALPGLVGFPAIIFALGRSSCSSTPSSSTTWV
jgi:hypothetical protein